MRSGPQSIAAGAFAVGENSPSAQTKGLGTRARVRIFACVTTILGPVRRGIYEAEKAIVNSGFGGTREIYAGFISNARIRSRGCRTAPNFAQPIILSYRTCASAKNPAFYFWPARG